MTKKKLFVLKEQYKVVLVVIIVVRPVFREILSEFSENLRTSKEMYLYYKKNIKFCLLLLL